jgi:chromosome segregation ATPase
MNSFSVNAPTPASALDPFDLELIALLRAEVSHLQSELTDRDVRLAEMSAQDAWTCAHAVEREADDELPEEQVAALLDRLESLLSELAESDRRVKTLEEMLQNFEQVAAAEGEEQRQVEAWIKDIEGRFAQRENEWRAEVEFLNGRLEDVTAERDRAEQMLARAHTPDRAAQMQQEVLHGLRRQVAQLGEQLAHSEKSRQDLERRYAAFDVEEAEHRSQERVAELLREERLQLAEERTELAVLRAELARAKVEIAEQEPVRAELPDEATTQIRALRQHLREIHEQEEHERDERRLSRRIARLWKRLEG